MKTNDRLQALRILQNVVEHRMPLSTTLQTNLEISSFTKSICFGVCRHYFRLQALAGILLNKKPPAIDIWLTLLIGLYQLQYSTKPTYAIVQETVALLDKLKKPWAKGLINATLRRFCRERSTLLIQVASQSSYQLGHPEWFIHRLQQDWPHEWQMILTANDAHPPMSLRVNEQKIKRYAYLKRLASMGINAHPHYYSPVGIMLLDACEVQKLPGFAEGEISIQDEAAQLAVYLLKLAPHLRVLDACAAPGGKTCHILEAEPHLAECVALDIDNKRLHRLQDNLARLHLHATIRQGDVLTPNTWWDGQLFDRILLDAPCSATGVIRRHPDIKLIRTEEEIQTITALQGTMLQRIWPLLKPQGLLVYATCSIMKAENEQQITNFITTHTDCQPVNEKQPWGYATGHGWQLLPGTHNTDGFFYSVLMKRH